MGIACIPTNYISAHNLKAILFFVNHNVSLTPAVRYVTFEYDYGYRVKYETHTFSGKGEAVYIVDMKKDDGTSMGGIKFHKFMKDNNLLMSQQYE